MISTSQNYINFATERPPTKRTANAASKGARDASDFEQSKQKQFDSSESNEINRQDAAKSEPTNFVDSLFQSENVGLLPFLTNLGRVKSFLGMS